MLMDPNLLRALKHSFIGKTVRSLAHFAFSLKFDPERPHLYHLPCDIDISLYPQGEVAEFLFFDKNFERTECELVASYLKAGMNVIDVGADGKSFVLRSDKGFGDAYRYLAGAASADHGDSNTAKSELVSVFSLDQFCRNQDIKTANLIKIDIEGGEYHFFKGQNGFSSQIMTFSSCSKILRTGRRERDTSSPMSGLYWNNSDLRCMPGISSVKSFPNPN